MEVPVSRMMEGSVGGRKPDETEIVVELCVFSKDKKTPRQVP